MRTKGIGPQGLGIKGNNGYIIGSPAKCWQGYARVPGTKKNAKTIKLPFFSTNSNKNLV